MVILLVDAEVSSRLFTFKQYVFSMNLPMVRCAGKENLFLISASLLPRTGVSTVTANALYPAFSALRTRSKVTLRSWTWSSVRVVEGEEELGKIHSGPWDNKENLNSKNPSLNIRTRNAKCKAFQYSQWPSQKNDDSSQKCVSYRVSFSRFPHTDAL